VADESQDEPIYDVFISYSHRDRGWVADQLVPRLREAGLRVSIDDDFRAGSSARENMAAAIRRSQRTLLVITAAWLESPHSAYESQIATMLDPDGRNRRVIPLRLEEVELPRELANLTYRDYVRPDAEAWANLLADLAADPTRRCTRRSPSTRSTSIESTARSP
jgi:hypothetical protein